MRAAVSESSEVTQPLSPPWWALSTAAEARAALAHVAQQVLVGRLSARDANAVTGAISALVSVLREASLEQRLETIEAALRIRE